MRLSTTVLKRQAFPLAEPRHPTMSSSGGPAGSLLLAITLLDLLNERLDSFADLFLRSVFNPYKWPASLLSRFFGLIGHGMTGWIGND